MLTVGWRNATVTAVWPNSSALALDSSPAMWLSFQDGKRSSLPAVTMLSWCVSLPRCRFAPITIVFSAVFFTASAMSQCRSAMPAWSATADPAAPRAIMKLSSTCRWCAHVVCALLWPEIVDNAVYAWAYLRIASSVTMTGGPSAAGPFSMRPCADSEGPPASCTARIGSPSNFSRRRRILRPNAGDQAKG
ncbi:UNVERIFIED_ORG: hypothetical protein MaF1725_ph0001 [Mycobacterium phage ADLER F1725]